MRSPNKRSRSKSNRPKSLGNIVNRVFDSSGPEGKVRGTPQQIIEKYQVLARDAQLSNDRVAAENFQQHAEHYTRLLAQAQREQAAEQEARRQTHDDRPRHNGNNGQEERGQGQPQHGQGNNTQPRRFEPPSQPNMQEPASDNGSEAFAVQDTRSQDDQGLVETPESAKSAEPAPEASPAPKPKRAPRARKPAQAEGEGDAPKPRRNTRKPRADAPATAPETPSEAAE